MPSREDYEHRELDLDGNYYYFMNNDVDLPYKVPKLQAFVKWWRENEVNNGVYYIGTRLYFTFEGAKYWVSWTFYDESYLDKAIKKLKALGALNIQLNYGRLD